MKRPITKALSLSLLASTLSVASAQTKGKPTTRTTPMQNAPTIPITRPASQPSQPAPAEYFTGTARISALPKMSEPSRLGGASVAFEAGARTNWHTHPVGQTLIVTEGVGRVQHWGGPVQEMRMGDVVQIPPGVKHWHGAAPDSAMTHVALAESQGGKAVDWLEKVSDEQYRQALPPVQTAQKGPSRAQQLMGDFAPKLAELTDEVLLGDVWKRPGLSPRDRSLITVASLLTGGNLDQLRSHLTLAKTNGVTEAEISEVMTHLAFYASWPKAISAITLAKEVFKK